MKDIKKAKNQKDKNYLIIYHKEDNDGVFSCGLFCKYLMKTYNINTFSSVNLLTEENFLNTANIGKNKIELYGTVYNDLTYLYDSNLLVELLQNQYYDSIIMVDISFNKPEAMKMIFDYLDYDFIWCDHHAPIIKESIKNFDAVPGCRNITKSAILNVWEYLFDPFNVDYLNKNIPEILRILSAWDSFSYESEGYSKEYVYTINEGVNQYFNLDIYKVINSDFLNLNIDELYNIGKTIVDFKTNYFKNIIQLNGDENWFVDNNRSAIMICYSAPSSSLMFDSVKDKYQNAIVIKKLNNDFWCLSLYNLDENDKWNCGQYLKEHYNGGGHIGAAGASFSLDQIYKIFKSKTL